MNKTEVVAAIAKEAGISKKDAENALKAFIDVVGKTLKKGGKVQLVQEALVKKDKVQLIGFGTFEVTKRGARTGRNPQTGETIKIKAAKTPKFKAGKALKDLVK